MRSKILCLGLLTMLAMPLTAQKLTLNLESDSTFNAANDDDDIRPEQNFDKPPGWLNEINIGAQFAQDLAYSSVNKKELEAGVPSTAYYRQRVDLIVTSALPERTNFYSILTFLNTEENSCQLTLSNLELEHFFSNNYKVRVGRLVNSISESMFFGRVALEETSSHVFGRKVFINDAVEFDGSFAQKGGPSFFLGFKPYYNHLNLKAVYAGIHQGLSSGLQGHAIVSVNRQLGENLRKYVPTFEGNVQSYFAYEAELAYKKPQGSAFLNVGGYLGYQGLIPHVQGKFDYTKQLNLAVLDTKDSHKETFTMATGFRLRPNKIDPSLKWLSQVGFETEVLGALTSKFTVLNINAFAKIGITRRLVLTYYCTPQFVWQYTNPDKPSFVGGITNFLRLSLTIGKPARTFM